MNAGHPAVASSNSTIRLCAPRPWRHDGTGTETGMVRVGRQAGPWRGGVLFLAVVLLPGAAWGQPVHDDRLDEMLWEEVGGCDGAEMYLKELPKGLHAEDARKCLAAGEVERLLEECEAHLAAGRLSTGRGGNAVDCLVRCCCWTVGTGMRCWAWSE